jgi:GNAT superfamily N-acetyltransferase
VKENTTRVIDLTDASGDVVERAWLLKAERVHRQLRPQLPADYTGAMERVFAGGGRLSVAVRGDEVTGVAVWRIHANTFEGLHMYVDDLVTDEKLRSSGVGKLLMDHLQVIARAAGCSSCTLDSGTQRQQAHKFYFREGLVVTSFHFSKPLK